MNQFTQRGRARRAMGSVRRRAGLSALSMIETLEERQLLAAGNFGLNVVISPYASFVNLLQVPGTWSDAPGNTNTLAYNASGDPESDASLYFDLRVNEPWDGPDPNAVPPNLSGTYSLSFNGQATIEPEYSGWSTPFSDVNQTYNAATNTTTVQLVVPTANYSQFFGISFLNTQATPTSGLNTGISNASLIRPGYAAGSTQLYTNQFLSALEPYSTLRYLGPDDANSQPFLNNNALVTEGAAQVDQTGMPWEYLITLANETQTDMWVNVPQGATNAYITAMADIFKNGGTVDGVYYPGLDSNLKIYLEYSNEVWGGIPSNEVYQEAAVQNSASNDPLSTFTGNTDIYNNVDGTTTTSVYTALGRRYLEETADIGQIFQSVLGSDPTHQRIRPVLGWQEGGFSFYPPALDWYQHFFGAASAAFYGMGDANYLDASNYTSVSATLSSMESYLTSFSIPDTTNLTTIATAFGLANVSYEGGPSIGADGSTSAGQVALATSRSPAMEQLILQEYQDFYAAGGTLALITDGPFDMWGPESEWPVAELAQINDPTASAKYRGTVDVADAAPVATTAGIAVPATGMTNFSASIDALNDNLIVPGTGEQGYWLLNVASAGTYDLKLTTVTNWGAPAGQVEVLINGHQQGGTYTVGNAGVYDLGNLSLSAGLNSLSIYVVHGLNDPSGVGYQFDPSTFTLMKPGGVLIGDPGFQNVNVGSGNVQYAPYGSLWTFSGTSGNGSGIAGVNSSMTSSNPAPPLGSQVAFLEGISSITQVVTDWSTGTYAITFDAAQRGNGGNSQNFEVLVDDNVVGTFDPNTTSYQSYTTKTFSVSPGQHVIEFLGLDSAGGDNTDLLNDVTLASATGSTDTDSNVAISGTATDSGSDALSMGEGAAAAFDGSATTNWLLYSNTGYLQYQFTGSASYVVTSYALTTVSKTSTNTGGAPRNWTFLGSNNGVNWTVLDTETNQNDALNGDTKSYSFANTTSYQYYRLNITANNGTNYIQVAELQLLTGTPPPVDVATGGTATDSGNDNATYGQGAAQAFDGSASTKWLTFSNTGYIQYQFGGGDAYVVTSYALTAGDDTSTYPGRAPRNWTFLGSNNGVTWTILDTETNQADTVSGDTRVYSIANTTAYQYYRLNVTADNGGPDVQLAELQLLSSSPPVPPSGVNVATGGTATDSGNDNSSYGQGAAQAFDGSASTKWLTFSNTGYIQYQFGGGDAYVVTSYALTAGDDTSTYPGRAPMNWTFLGSNNGVTWTILDTETNQADTVSGDTRSYSFTNTTAYQYYRLNITANNGGPDIQLAELQLISSSPPVTSTPLVNVATGGTATDSGNDNATYGQGAAQAFDGSAATKWLTLSNSGWIQYQFGGGNAYVVTQYGLTAGNDTSTYTGRAPLNWTFLGSNNGVTWTTLDTETNQADTESGDTRLYSIANTTAYQYYRLNITANNGGPYIQLAELQLLAAEPTLPTIGDAGFETVSVGTGNYVYSPAGSAWTFVTTPNVGGSGVSGNNSSLTSGNPSAPQGSQVGFIEAVASFSQSIPNWVAGTYALSFDAAQSATNGTQDENFEVLVDGKVVGTYQPTSTTYQEYATSNFTVTAGAHTIEFLGLDSAEGNDTILIDDVTVED